MINIKNKALIIKFGKRLKYFRKVQNLSQEHLANLADIPISQVGRIERGEINPTLSTINELSIALHIELYLLLKNL